MATIINTARIKQWGRKTLPEEVGRYLRKMDTALPGKYTRRLYNSLKRGEANVLA